MARLIQAERQPARGAEPSATAHGVARPWGKGPPRLAPPRLPEYHWRLHCDRDPINNDKHLKIMLPESKGSVRPSFSTIPTKQRKSARIPIDLRCFVRTVEVYRRSRRRHRGVGCCRAARPPEALGGGAHGRIRLADLGLVSPSWWHRALACHPRRPGPGSARRGPGGVRRVKTSRG